LALFALGLSLATSLAVRRNVANHSQPLALNFSTLEVNKPQARISGVGDFHSIEVTSCTLALDDFRIWTLAREF
jgi:predicted membrane protein